MTITLIDAAERNAEAFRLLLDLFPFGRIRRKDCPAHECCQMACASACREACIEWLEEVIMERAVAELSDVREQTALAELDATE